MSPLRPVLLAAALLSPAAARAQVTASVDVGAGTYRPDRAIPGGIASLAPTLTYQAGPLRVGGTGVYSDAPAGRWNAQATGFTQIRSPRWGPVEAELGGQVDVTRHFRANGSNSAIAELRLYAYPFRGLSLWAAQGFGSASALDRRRPLRRSQVGTSARVGQVELGFSVASTTFELMGGPFRTESDTARSPFPELPSSTNGSPGRRTSLTDAILSSRWSVADLEFDMAVGRRFSQNAPEITIWGVSASHGITPGLALVAGAGRSGSDPVTSVPGARYFVLGLRLKVGPPAGGLYGSPASYSDNSPFRVGPALPAGREVLIRVPGADRVELAGDFTDWRPIDLQPVENGAWRALLPIAPGLHRLAIRIDDGEWQAPPGSRPIASEFGGEVAEIVVE